MRLSGVVSKGAKVAGVLMIGAGGALMAPAALNQILSEVIAALAILSAFLIQLMFLLATVFNPGRLNSAQVERIATQLHHDQVRATTLFGAYVVAIVFLLAVKATYVADVAGVAAVHTAALSVANRALAGLAGLACGYCALGTLRFMRALHSLQSLRHELLVREAKEREKAEQRAAADRVAYVPPPPSAGSYGRRYEHTAT